MKKIKKYNSGGPTSKIGQAAASAATSNSSSSQQSNVDAMNKARLDEVKKQKEPKKQTAPTSNSKPVIMAKKGGSVTALNKVQEMYSKKKK